jgi:hypothetical protein
MSYVSQTHGIQLVPISMTPVCMRQIAVRVLYSGNCSAVSAQGKRDKRNGIKVITSAVEVDRPSPILE